MTSGNGKVVICIPCLLVGGTEMHALALARALVEGGYAVTVCAYYEHDPLMVQEVERAGARVRLLGLKRQRGLRGMARLARELRRVFHEEHPRFVHVEYMTPGVAPIVTARLCRMPSTWLGPGPRVLATVHVPGRHYGRHIWLPRMAARLCDVFLCVSQAAEEAFFGSGALFDEALLRQGRRHFTIHNAVDLDEVDAIIASGRPAAKRRELGLEGHPVVGVVGRLSREKGQRWLLDAMGKVVRRLPSARLVVVGDGASREELVAHAERVGLNGRVVWAGKVPREEALVHFGLMDVVAVPSLWEGFGLSAVEAMAFGKPVVASDVDGLREVVSDRQTGLLVPCEDAGAMADALVGLLREPVMVRRLGAAGRLRVEERFSARAFAERHRRLYAALGEPRAATASVP